MKPLIYALIIIMLAPTRALADMPVIDLATVPPGEIGVGYPNLQETSEVPTPGAQKFRLKCGFAGARAIDPLVYPGQANAGHHHTFFGNTGFSENSTNYSLRASPISTCDGGSIDAFLGWVPSMVNTANGEFVRPNNLLVYYVGSHLEGLKTLPKGLAMIAGDPSNSSGSTWYQANKKVAFYCAGGVISPLGEAAIPNCPAGSALNLKLFFPECWNGTALDSTNHKSHMAFAGTGDWKQATPITGCPSSHPVRVPQIMYLIVYPNTVGSMVGWRLASDGYADSLPGGLSAHADYIEGFMVPFFNMVMDNCLLGKKDCGVGNLGNGLKLY